MSNINVKGLVDNIRSNTTVFTPLIELIVNAIQAIEEAEVEPGRIKVHVKRSTQGELYSLPPIVGIEVKDNGIGFTEKNRNSFDELYTDYKIKKGGKGFGRFVCLKYFKGVHIKSIYSDGDNYKMRTFAMGLDKEIIVNEDIQDTSEKETGTSVTLIDIKDDKFLNKKLDTIARSLVEKLLPYFVSEKYCPEILLSEANGSNAIILNQYIGGKEALIQELSIDSGKFSLGSDDRKQDFSIRIFKIYSPGSQHSKISLIAHQREVTEVSTHSYVPEFIDEFYDKLANGNNNQERNYIVKSYVLGQYLDNHVSLERGGFEFNTDKEILNTIEQNHIESTAADLTKNAIGQEITVRQEKKQTRVTQYIEQDAPWHRKIVEELDLSALSYNASNEDIEIELQKIKIKKEVDQKRKVNHVLESTNLENSDISIQELVDEISENSKNDLVHYVASRRLILDIFRKSLKRNKEGKYSSEGLMHDIIFPRKKNSEIIEYEQQNLWIIDERLNFTTYLSSDVPLKGNSDRPDIINYGQRVAFRGDNVKSNPITIFEFKKPGEEGFINPSAWKKDPVDQIKRYVTKIRKGEFTTPDGRNIQVTENTPFYGYIICEISKKVEEWLYDQKSFKALPDGLGWFHPEPNINLYMEALSWDKLLNDADMRNKIFFRKLGI